MAYWFKSAKYIIQRELRISFASPVVVAGFIFSLATMLMILWYTSKAFIPSFDYLGGNSSYFEFVLIGEIFLLAPLAAIHSYTKATRTMLYEKTMDPHLLSPRPFFTTLFLLQLGPFTIEAVRWLVLILIGFFLLPDSLSIGLVAPLLLLQALTLPMFWSLGQMASAFLIRFGRGQNFISMFMTLFAILGGVYFPTHVLPDPIHQLFSNYSPFNIVLDLSRVVLALGWQEADWQSSLFALLCWTIVLLPVSAFALRRSLRHYRSGNHLNYLVQ